MDGASHLCNLSFFKPVSLWDLGVSGASQRFPTLACNELCQLKGRPVNYAGRLHFAQFKCCNEAEGFFVGGFYQYL